ncbi:hypothetical protein AKO1_007823 [Acrasis kona]|uniref:Uncharacterized protein n=1 Tax=Acrasis kona TaxID=1008807 RepID=A0AAW2YNE6_9EUKA
MAPVLEDEKVLGVTTSGDNIKFVITYPRIIEFSMPNNHNLLQFVEKTSSELSQSSEDLIHSARFIIENKAILSLSLKLKDAFLETRPLSIIINNEFTYIVDVNNQYNALGNSETKNKNYAKAGEYYTQSIHRFPTNPIPRLNRSLVFNRLGMFQESVDDANVFFELSKSHQVPDKSHNRGIIRRGNSYFGLAENATEIQSKIKYYLLSLNDLSCLPDESGKDFYKEFDFAWRFLLHHCQDPLKNLPACPICRKSVLSAGRKMYQGSNYDGSHYYMCNNCNRDIFKELEFKFNKNINEPFMSRSKLEQNSPRPFVCRNVKDWFYKYMVSLGVKVFITRNDQDSLLNLNNDECRSYQGMIEILNCKNLDSIKTKVRQYFVVGEPQSIDQNVQNSVLVSKTRLIRENGEIRFTFTSINDTYYFVTQVVAPALEDEEFKDLKMQTTVTTKTDKIEIASDRKFPRSLKVIQNEK